MKVVIMINFQDYDYLETTIDATIVADSYSNLTQQRITTALLTVPKFINAELNTHRLFSRNVASSRAIRFEKQLQNATFHPVILVKNHPGMQGNELITGWRKYLIDTLWESSRYSAISHAWMMNKLGLSKQWTNRTIEPYLFISYLVTSTEWDNFFNQRDHNDAQFEMQVVARRLKNAMNNSNPNILTNDEFHLPFISTNELEQQQFLIDGVNTLIKLSAARCAKTSYSNQSKTDYENDIKLFNRLYSAVPRHNSPFEHIATPAIGQYYNLIGWKNVRYLIDSDKQFATSLGQ